MISAGCAGSGCLFGGLLLVGVSCLRDVLFIVVNSVGAIFLCGLLVVLLVVWVMCLVVFGVWCSCVWISCYGKLGCVLGYCFGVVVSLSVAYFVVWFVLYACVVVAFCDHWFRGFGLFGCLVSVIGFVFWLGVALIVWVRLLGAFVLVASLLDFCWVLLDLWYLICWVWVVGMVVLLLCGLQGFHGFVGFGCFVWWWVLVLTGGLC